MRRVAVIVLCILAAVVVLVGTTRIQDHEGYFSPVYSADGQFVYFIGRHTRGLVTGWGWESFSPPAHVFVWHDRFSLSRLELETGEVEVVTTLPPSPVEDRHIRTYRGRAFTVPSTILRWSDAGRLQLRVRVSVPTQPTSEQHFLEAEWDGGTRALTIAPDWSREWLALTGDDMSPLFENWEVVAVGGPEAFPCALVRHEAVSNQVRVLVQQRGCDDFYPGGITAAELTGLTRRADIERARSLEDTRARLTREALESGLSEGDAALRVIDQMTELGFYRQPPQLVAQSLDPTAVDVQRLTPLFVIEETQFTVGLFQDLARALDSPGLSVDKSMGTYIVHNDYTTSQELNSFLQGGGSTFYVQRGERVFELRVSPP